MQRCHWCASHRQLEKSRSGILWLCFFVFCILYWCIGVFCISTNAAMPLLCKSAPIGRVTQWHFVIVYFVFCILYWCISVFCVLTNAAMPLLCKSAPTRRVTQWHFVWCDCVFSSYWCILYFVFCEMHIEVLCKSAATGGVTKTSCTSIIVHVSYLHEQWTINKPKHSAIRT